MDTFGGHSSTFWVAIEALGVCANTVFVVITLWFIYRQVRTAAISFKLDAIRRLQELVDNFRDDRGMLFANCALELALVDEQFQKQPPTRHAVHRLGNAQIRKMVLTPDQLSALRAVSDEVKQRARRVIEKLNDIGQLVEDGFVDKRVFFGKYHIMVIQCCHMVEAIRRQEEAARGGAYGQRLLRIRRRAIIYNDIWPKHRALPIKIAHVSTNRLVICNAANTPPMTEQRVIYMSPTPTVFRMVIWAMRRWLSWY